MCKKLRGQHLTVPIVFLLFAVTLSGCRPPEPTVSPLSSPVSTPPSPLPSLSGRLAFTSDAMGNYDIYVLDITTGEALPIVTSPERDIDPVWSPTGERLAFASAQNNPNELDIFLVNADGSGLEQLTFVDGFEVNPAWSPDGRTLAYHGNQTGDFEIYLYDLESGTTTNITNNPAADYQADWSPDGQQIVFASQRSGNSEIWLMKRDGSELRQLTNWSTSNQWHPRWSPDGQTIIFVSDRDETGGAVYAVLVRGGEPVRLTPPGLVAIDPTWIGGGEAIVFSGPAQGEDLYDLWVMTLSNHTPQLLWPGLGSDLYPAWAP